MYDLIKNKALAFQYFEGKISSEDEIGLFEFINESDENRMFFRQWEKEWLENGQMEQVALNADWEKVKPASEVSIQEPDDRKLITFWRAISAVAAIGLLLLGTGLMLNYMRTNAQSQIKTMVQAPKGEKSKIVLYDGSVVWLNSDSKLTYPASAKDSKFVVKLDGEAYFEVAKNSERTFVVETVSYDIEVKGTKFNVTAYADDDFITTTLVEGAIDIFYKNKKMSVIPNETVTLDVKTGEFSRASGELEGVGAWTKNYILYENITLDELVVKLSHQYGINISVQDLELKSKSLTLSLRNDETAEDVMKAIEKVLPVKIFRDGKNYQIKEK